MARNRMVNTRIWSDPRVLDLDPSEKLLWVYLITNDHTSICGIYEIHPRVIAMETWFDKDMIEKILTRFTSDKKIKRYKNRIHLIKFTEHQASNPSVEKWIERELNEISEEVKDGLSNSIIQPVPSLWQLGLLNLTKPNLTKLKPNGNLWDLFDEFWKLYPRKKWKWDIKKYPSEHHNEIMIWLRNYISEYESLAKLWKTVPDWQYWSTWINKKTWLDYQDSKAIEELNFEAIYQEYIKDYENNYAENWKKKYWVSQDPDSLFRRCKKRWNDEWLFR